jgi:2-amino-4-hydroxy-6-hydroxymethyldihydropteridine diphosphokinase
MVLAYLGLGSNLGDRVANLAGAAARIGELPGCTVLAHSSIYETEPIGPPDQDWYLNAAVAVETALEPRALLAAVKRVEEIAGRVPGERWGPRLIDVDILTYGDTVMNSSDLTIPHRELWNRRFALAPLADICADGPQRDRIVARLEALSQRPIVRRYDASDATQWATKIAPE